MSTSHWLWLRKRWIAELWELCRLTECLGFPGTAQYLSRYGLQSKLESHLIELTRSFA